MAVNYFNDGARSKSNYNELAETVEDIDFNVKTKMSKLFNAKGNAIVESTLDGEVQEGMFSVMDLTHMIGTTKTDNEKAINVLQTTKLNRLPEGTEAGHIVVTDANRGMVTSSVTLQEIEAKSIPKIANPKDLSRYTAKDIDGYIMVSDGAGGVKEGYMSQSGFITRITNRIAAINSPAGDKLVLSTSDGNVKESALAEADITNRIAAMSDAAGDKIVLSKANGGVKESALTVNDIMSRIFRDSFETFRFPGPLLLPHKRRLHYDTTFLGITVDLELKPEYANKTKKVTPIFFTPNGLSSSAIQEFTLSAEEQYKSFAVEFTLSKQNSYNFRLEVEGVSNLNTALDYARIEWYYQ